MQELSDVLGGLTEDQNDRLLARFVVSGLEYGWTQHFYGRFCFNVVYCFSDTLIS